MTLGIGTLPTRRQPVRVIRAVYPVQTREQRRLMARNAGHMGRLAALGAALLIAAVAVFSTGGSDDTQASSGLPVLVPEASAHQVIETMPSFGGLQLLTSSEGRA